VTICAEQPSRQRIECQPTRSGDKIAWSRPYRSRGSDKHAQRCNDSRFDHSRPRR
jgi:hypothetical protein